jgi:phosphopantothenoylcysteine decarboxylase/phosphopantothenate--cysteine ligase
MLKGKKIVLGITGSIAAYKACIIIRELVKRGAEVQVVITPAGKEFITPITLSALTQKPVISDFFSQRDGTWHSHVSLGLWADAMVVAPATASTIGKMANGIADNMLITTYLSMKAPVFVAPAMDLDMWAHSATQHNLDVLRQRGVTVIEPASGELASHLIGKGRMEEPENIVKALDSFFAQGEDLQGKRVIITAGPTVEKIDPVRFISNFSSGKMGFALAEECARRGALVTLVAGPVSLKTENANITRIDVTTAMEMYDAVMHSLPQSDAIILCAAVADYRVADVAEKKIKREKDAAPVLHLTPNPDIAKAVGQNKRADQVSVGFALETDNEQVNAQGKLERKKLNFIVMNSLRDKNSGFQVDTNRVTIITADGQRTDYPVKPKREVATDIVNAICNLITH